MTHFAPRRSAMGKSFWFACVAFLLAAAPPAFAKVIPEEPTKTLEDVEDVRLQFCLSAYRIHELEHSEEPRVMTGPVHSVMVNPA